MKKKPSPSRREEKVTLSLGSPTFQALHGEAIGIVRAVLAALKGKIPDTVLNAWMQYKTYYLTIGENLIVFVNIFLVSPPPFY